MTIIRFKRKKIRSCIVNNKKSIVFENIQYSSRKELAVRYGIKPILFNRRIKWGWSIEEALGIKTRDKLNNTKSRIEFEGVVYPTLTQLCKNFKIKRATVYSRLNSGWSLKEALSVEGRRDYRSINTPGVIYVITNNKNNKVYVGLTIKSVQERLKQHILLSKKESSSKLSKAIRELGSKNFKISVVERCRNLIDLQNKEIDHINKYNSVEQGYNSIKGGSLGSCVKPVPIALKDKIFESKKEMLEHYRITDSCFSYRINSGYTLEQALGVEKYYKYTVEINGELVAYNDILDLCHQLNLNYDSVMQHSYKYSKDKIEVIKEKCCDRSTIISVGMDMGIKNTAISVVKKSGTSSCVLYSVILPPTVTKFDNNIQEHTQNFMNLVEDVIKKHNPDIITCESFYQRGFRSNLATYINYFIGIVSVLAIKNKVKFGIVLPASWKKNLEKHVVKVDELYDRTYPVKNRLPDHIIDSLLIGVYASVGSFDVFCLKDIKNLVNEGAACYRNLKQNQIDTIKAKAKNFKSLLNDIEHVNKQELERKKSKKPKKRKKSRNP